MLLSDQIKKTISTLVTQLYDTTTSGEKFKANLISALQEIANNFLKKIREDTLNSQGRDFELSLVRSINIYRRAVEDSHKDWKESIAENPAHTAHSRLFDEKVDDLYKYLHWFLEDDLYHVYMDIYKEYPKALSSINRIYKEHKFEHHEYQEYEQ